jgi:hypothetical protein
MLPGPQRPEAALAHDDLDKTVVRQDCCDTIVHGSKVKTDSDQAHAHLLPLEQVGKRAPSTSQRQSGGSACKQQRQAAVQTTA